MALQPIRYPFDKTGVSPDNLVLNEVKELRPTKVRAFVPTYGGFYTESFVLRDVATNQVLRKGVQYKFDNLYEMATKHTGKEICGVVVVLDPTVSNRVSYDYQVVGGMYGYSGEAIIQQIEALKLDNRPIEWGNVFNKPAVYPPSKHLHDIGDVYGFEYVVEAINQLRHAVLIGDEGAHNVIYEYIDKNNNTQNIRMDSLLAMLNEHSNNTSNPHQTTAEQVGAYTKQVTDSKIKVVNDKLTSHETNYNNPHRTTAEQVGAYDKTYIDNKLKELNDGVVAQFNLHAKDYNNPHRTTAAQVGAYTKQETDSKVTVVQNALNAFIARLDNPHNVTASQTGAYTKAEADAKYKVISDKLSSHETNYSNPHKVTAAQTGAYTKAETDKKITDLINSTLGMKGGKLSPDVIPLSTRGGNLITVDATGIYYGIQAPAETAVLYVDAVAGVDEEVTRENRCGTKDKPLKTIAFALSQGPGDVSRTIYLKEGQSHNMGMRLTRWIGWPTVAPVGAWEGQVYDVENRAAVFRGGNTHILPYGPNTDALPYVSGSSLKQYNPTIHDSASTRTKILLNGFQITRVNTGDWAQGFNLYPYAATNDSVNKATIIFSGVEIVHQPLTGAAWTACLNDPLMKGMWNGGLMNYFARDTSISLRNIRIRLNRTPVASTSSNMTTLPLLTASDEAQTHEVFIARTFNNDIILGGAGKLFVGGTKDNAGIYLYDKYNNASFVQQYCVNTAYKYGSWLNFRSNVNPPDDVLPSASTNTNGLVMLSNDLNDTSSTKALTAAQGKVLNDKLNAVEAKANNAGGGIISNQVVAFDANVSSANGTFVLPKTCTRVKVNFFINTSLSYTASNTTMTCRINNHVNSEVRFIYSGNRTGGSGHGYFHSNTGYGFRVVHANEIGLSQFVGGRTYSWNILSTGERTFRDYTILFECIND